MTARLYAVAKVWQFWLMLALYTWAGVTPSPGETLGNANDLVLHFAGYLIAGISIGLYLPARPVWQHFGLLFLYSLAIEIIQHFVPHRSFDLRDLLANGAGLVAGLLLYRWPVRAIDRWLSRLIAPNPAA